MKGDGHDIMSILLCTNMWWISILIPSRTLLLVGHNMSANMLTWFFGEFANLPQHQSYSKGRTHRDERKVCVMSQKKIMQVVHGQVVAHIAESNQWWYKYTSHQSWVTKGTEDDTKRIVIQIMTLRNNKILRWQMEEKHTNNSTHNKACKLLNR